MPLLQRRHRVAECKGRRGLIQDAAGAESLEPIDAHARRAALRAVCSVGNARQAIGNSLQAEIRRRGEALSGVRPMSDAVHLGDTEIIQQVRRERLGPSKRQVVIVRASDLLALRPDDEVSDVRDAPAPLAMKNSEDLIRW